jgi:3-isopropylmalate/(R)-2-methylmalate dehydratase small subunit
MEIAVTVILAAGIPAVVAGSFSRTFYRNAINNGLVPIECDTSGIVEGDKLTVRFSGTRTEVEDARTGAATAALPMPGFMQEVLEAGGLVPYLRERGGWGELRRGKK